MPTPSEPTARELNPLLTAAATEVLESMFFMGVMGELDEVACQDPACLGVKLDFRGQQSGSVGLRASKATAQTIAANFLGDDPTEIDVPRSLETLCELANMVCGSFLSAYAAADVFDLTHPAIDATLPDEDLLTATRSIELDEGTLFIWLVLNPRAEPVELEPAA